MNRNDPVAKALSVIQTLYDSALPRPRRTISIRPLLMPATSSAPAGKEGFGALVLVLAREGHPLLDELRSRAEGAGEDFLGYLSERVSIPTNRKQISIVDAVEVAKNLPSLVDIRHGGQSLASNIPILEDGTPSIYVFPYKGGELNSRGITAIERYIGSPAIDVFAALFPPVLNPTQKAALECLGDDERESLIMPPSMCYAASAVGIALVVEAVALAATHTGSPQFLEDPLGDKDSCDSSASVEDLLAERHRRMRERV